MKPGDVIRYSSGDWCRHGIAVVEDDNHAWDTYWGKNAPTQGQVRPEELRAGTLLGNLNDFTERVAYPFTFEDYRDEDTLFIPVGGRTERKYIRVGALPVRDQVVSRLISKIDFAVYAVERAKAELVEAEKQLMATEGIVG